MSVTVTSECHTVHARIRAGQALGDEGRAHVDSCPACGELVGGLGRQLDSLDLPDEEPLEEMADALDSRLGAPSSFADRVRAWSTPARASAMAAVVAGSIAIVLGGSRRVDLELVPGVRYGVALGLLAVGLIAVVAMTLRPLHRSRPPAWATTVTMTLAAAGPLVVALLPAAHRDHPDSLLGVGRDFLARAASCFGFGLGWAVVMIAAAWLLDRQYLRRPGVAALVLLGGAVLGNLLLVLHCPLVEPAHKLGGHATVTAAAILLALGASLRDPGARDG